MTERWCPDIQIPSYSEAEVGKKTFAKLSELPKGLDPEISFLSTTSACAWLGVRKTLFNELKSALEFLGLIPISSRRKGYSRQELMLLLVLRVHYIARGKDAAYQIMGEQYNNWRI